MIKDVMTTGEQLSLWIEEIGIDNSRVLNPVTELDDHETIVMTYLYQKLGFSRKKWQIVVLRSFPQDKDDSIIAVVDTFESDALRAGERQDVVAKTINAMIAQAML